MLPQDSTWKGLEFNALCGEPEQSFSPDWHAKNPHVPTGSVLQGIKDSDDAITIVLGYRKTPGGDVTIAQYESEEEMMNDPDRAE